MNDFTKEDLEFIKLCVREHYKNNTTTKGYDYIKEWENWLPRLQSMIDNYCEHDWRKGVHLFNDIYCTKCKKHFEINNPE